MTLIDRLSVSGINQIYYILQVSNTQIIITVCGTWNLSRALFTV